MAQNQTGIAIVIKARLPVTGNISEQIAKLQMVEQAHASGDYSELLAASKIDEIKTEQKTRRIDDAAEATEPAETMADDPTPDQTSDAEEADEPKKAGKAA